MKRRLALLTVLALSAMPISAFAGNQTYIKYSISVESIGDGNITISKDLSYLNNIEPYGTIMSLT